MHLFWGWNGLFPSIIRSELGMFLHPFKSGVFCKLTYLLFFDEVLLSTSLCIVYQLLFSLIYLYFLLAFFSTSILSIIFLHLLFAVSAKVLYTYLLLCLSL